MRALLIAFMFFSVINETEACTCSGVPSLTKSYVHSDLIVSGTVKDTKFVSFKDLFEQNEWEPPTFEGSFDSSVYTESVLLSVTFEVTRVFKSFEVAETITIYTAVSSAACGFRFKMNEEYVVFGYKEPPLAEFFLFDQRKLTLQPNSYSTHTCSMTSIKTDALIKELDSLEKQENAFFDFVTSVPILDSGYTAESDETIEHFVIESDFIPDGAAMMGRVPSREGYHFLVYCHPDDIHLPILEMYDSLGEKILERSLFRYSECPPSDSGYSRFELVGTRVIIIVTICDAYNSNAFMDVIELEELIPR